MINKSFYKKFAMGFIIATAWLPTMSARADAMEVPLRSLPSYNLYQINSKFELSEAPSSWKKIEFKMGPGYDYWKKVAQCETKSNWQDKGNYGGGLGIALSTWQGYGGEEFAAHPSQATPIEQMIVANRIAVYGYQTPNTYISFRDKINNKPFRRPPVGFNGWGCIKNTVKPPKDITYTVYLPKGKRYYCKNFEELFTNYALPAKVFSYIAWRESRCNPGAVNAIWKNGKIVWTLNKNGSYDSGLLQINSTWFKALKEQLGHQPKELFNPHVNALFASWLLHYSSNGLGNWNIKAQN